MIQWNIGLSFLRWRLRELTLSLFALTLVLVTMNTKNDEELQIALVSKVLMLLRQGILM